MHLSEYGQRAKVCTGRAMTPR
uniref:Uncharacterized protein n=1 Tax=Anguilla anguilla TaxID=7936 RepID=A0A0E9US29_ANGAN